MPNGLLTLFTRMKYGVQMYSSVQVHGNPRTRQNKSHDLAQAVKRPTGSKLNALYQHMPVQPCILTIGDRYEQIDRNHPWSICAYTLPTARGLGPGSPKTRARSWTGMKGNVILRYSSVEALSVYLGHDQNHPCKLSSMERHFNLRGRILLSTP